MNKSLYRNLDLEYKLIDINKKYSRVYIKLPWVDDITYENINDLYKNTRLYNLYFSSILYYDHMNDF